MRMRLDIYVYVVSAAGIGLLFYFFPGNLSQIWPGLLFFLTVSLLSEQVPVPLPWGDGTVSVSFAIALATILVYGPEAGILVAAFGTLRRKELMGEVPPKVLLFNRGQLALSAGLGGLAYVASGGSVGQIDLVRSILPLLSGSFIYILVNTTLVTIASTLSRKSTLTGAWLVNFKWAAPSLMALSPIGLLIAGVYLDLGALAVILFFVPLLMARYSFQRYADVRETYLGTISALVAALDAKDRYTYGHSKRVASYAVAIGRQLKLNEKDLELLANVGELHDVGKIGIQDLVLNKPGKFTHNEYIEMRKHPEIGAKIVGGVRNLDKESKWVLCHHERYDGTGYPRGLKGDEIPLGARIIAVADAFDAMTSKRPYKNHMTREEVIDELRKGSGNQFDPQVVDALMRIMDRIFPEQDGSGSGTFADTLVAAGADKDGTRGG